MSTTHRLFEVTLVHLKPTQLRTKDEQQTNRQHTHRYSQIFPTLLADMDIQFRTCHHTNQHEDIVGHLWVKCDTQYAIKHYEWRAQPILLAEYSIESAYHGCQEP